MIPFLILSTVIWSHPSYRLLSYDCIPHIVHCLMIPFLILSSVLWPHPSYCISSILILWPCPSYSPQSYDPSLKPSTVFWTISHTIHAPMTPSLMTSTVIWPRPSYCLLSCDPVPHTVHCNLTLSLILCTVLWPSPSYSPLHYDAWNLLVVTQLAIHN